MDRLAEKLLFAFGWCLGKAPVALVAVFCRLLGAFTYHFSDRRHSILSALARAFPERSAAWRDRICREHCARMFEMFLIVLALPHWSRAKQTRRIQLGESMKALIQGPAREHPMIFAIPHSSMMEAICLTPLLDPALPPVVTLYRPLDFGPAERYVHWARENWGVRLVSRREGLLAAKKQLQTGRGVAAILFDQSAGDNGHLMLFFNRVCSTTNLPGMLAAKTGARTAVIYLRRQRFWQGVIEAKMLEPSENPAITMAQAHEVLEDLLRRDDSACADWFWAHKRWKALFRPPQLLAFPDRKSYLEDQLKHLGLSALPRHNRLAVWLSPAVALLPASRQLVDLLQRRRPDATIHLLVPTALAAEALPTHDAVTVLPEGKKARAACLRELNATFLDALFVLDPDPAAIAAARHLEVEVRVGVHSPEAPRKILRVGHEVVPADYLAAPWEAWSALLTRLGMTSDQIAAARAAADAK